MNPADLVRLMVPAHEIVIEVFAVHAHHEIRSMADRARADLDERFRQIAAFTNRSIAQQIRFRNVRALQEKA